MTTTDISCDNHFRKDGIYSKLESFILEHSNSYLYLIKITCKHSFLPTFEQKENEAENLQKECLFLFITTFLWMTPVNHLFILTLQNLYSDWAAMALKGIHQFWGSRWRMFGVLMEYP